MSNNKKENKNQNKNKNQKKAKKINTQEITKIQKIMLVVMGIILIIIGTFAIKKNNFNFDKNTVDNNLNEANILEKKEVEIRDDVNYKEKIENTIRDFKSTFSTNENLNIENKPEYIEDENNYIKLDTYGNLVEFRNLKNLFRLDYMDQYFENKEQIIELVESNGYIDTENYSLRFESDYQIVYIKNTTTNVFNMQDAYIITFEQRHDTLNNIGIISFEKFEDYTEVIEPEISENKAKELAKEYLEKEYPEEEISITEIILTVKGETDLNIKFEKEIEEGLQNRIMEFMTVWEVKTENYTVYLDVLNGDVLGDDGYKGNKFQNIV